MKSTVSYIIIQAGGRGSRLGNLTTNKPKALVSVESEPIILNQMKKQPNAEFLVIMDYQRDVFKSYLSLFSSYKYNMIAAVGKGTCSGIKSALKKIPQNTPFIIVWCDLYFTQDMLPKRILPIQSNYIGLSKTFPCRWSFKKGKLIEEKSADNGIAGLFIFKDKNEIKDIPENGEWCRYLQEKNIKFRKFFLKKVHEVGTIDAYEKVKENFPNTRPFNKLLFKKNKVVKIAKDSQGEELARKESNWYEHINVHKRSYILNIFKSSPLTMQRITGGPLYQYSFSDKKKEEILKKIIANAHDFHNLFPEKKGSAKNDFEAILAKTKKRLDSIISLIPDSKNPYIIINGKKCKNFYLHWGVVEDLLKPFFGNRYTFIHGDPTFSNILYDENEKKSYFIDPRGYYGKHLLYGDEDYDWAKLYYSLVGNYDQFNNKKFQLSINEKNNILTIESNQWEHLSDTFFRLTKRDRKKIEAYHAILWLSLSSYAWDDYDSICGAFYNGIYLMQQYYEKTL